MISFCGSLAKNDAENLLVEVLESGTTLVSAQNHYRAVSDGFIKVKGLLWPVTLKKDRGGASICDFETGADLLQIMDCYLDLPHSEDTNGITFFCMPVQFVEQDSVPAPSLVGLILRTTDEDHHTFRRIGLYSENPKYVKIYYSDKGRKNKQHEQTIFSII